MKVTFLGAAEAVTGSCYLVETDQTSFLVDCGLHQGRQDETRLNRAPFPFDMNQIDFLLLTHAHIDHSGRIPRLYSHGFRSPIYTTKATADLCGIMLPDSGHIQEMEYEWRNRKNRRAGKNIEPPLYTVQDAFDSLGLFERVHYDHEFSPASDVRVVMRDAGHILGSAILEIWIKEDGHEVKIVFSGDLGNKEIAILRDPTIIDGCDYLVIESTYGDRMHEETEDKVEHFVRIINETIARGGDGVIPSFAVGRTQEIIYQLNKEADKYSDSRLPFMQTPVYVDSPLAISATKIFRENTDCYDEEAREYILNGDNPLDFPNLHFTPTAEESKQLNISDESKIIISASGMCDAGRIKHHLKHNLWRPESTILFVGFQAQGTLGRRLVDGAKTVRIFNEEIAVHARIEQIRGFSGHADLDGLIGWIDSMTHKPHRIMLVHGEPDTIKSFSKTIEDRFHIEAHIALLDETVNLGAVLRRSGAARLHLLEDPLDHRISVMTRTLDELQAELALLTERSKSEIRDAVTQDERSRIVEQYRELVKKKADEILASIH